MHILLVDDDPGLRSTAACILVQEGYEVKQANNGNQALRMVLDSVIGNDQYDLVIADVMMPNLSGMYLLKIMRANGILIPVLVISGYLDALIFEELHKLEPLDYILKPFNPDEFIRYVEELIATHHDPAVSCLRPSFGMKIP